MYLPASVCSLIVQHLSKYELKMARLASKALKAIVDTGVQHVCVKEYHDIQKVAPNATSVTVVAMNYDRCANSWPFYGLPATVRRMHLRLHTYIMGSTMLGTAIVDRLHVQHITEVALEATVLQLDEECQKPDMITELLSGFQRGFVGSIHHTTLLAARLLPAYTQLKTLRLDICSREGFLALADALKASGHLPIEDLQVNDPGGSMYHVGGGLIFCEVSLPALRKLSLFCSHAWSLHQQYLPRLEDLSIMCHPDDAYPLRGIRSLTQLKRLRAVNAETDEGLECLDGLQELCIVYRKTDGNLHLDHIQQCKQLQDLRIQGYSVDWREIRKCKTLERLGLYCCHNMTESETFAARSVSRGPL